MADLNPINSYHHYIFASTLFSLICSQVSFASQMDSSFLSVDKSGSQSLGHISELNVDDGVQKSELKLSRHKRYVTVNIEGTFNVGFLISIPIIIIVPQMSNLFNKWRRRRSTSEYGENEIEDIFEDSAAVQTHLNKIATYFNLLEIPEHVCHVRAICEFAAEPDKYYPLSDVVLRKLRDPVLPAFLSYDENETIGNLTSPISKKSLYKVYNNAADYGNAYGETACQSKFGTSCRYSMEKLLNMSVLRFWTGIGKMLQLQFADDY